MKIAIIGGGWVGCHLTKVLQQDHNVFLFEKEKDLFNKTSLYNQNRLHQGFHYARNSKTRKLCLDTFDLFLKDYGHLTQTIKNNIYSVPEKNSLIDFNTYISIFSQNNIPFEHITLSEIRDIEGSIVVDERHINPIKAKKYFNEILKDKIVQKHIKNIDDIKNEFDLIIDCTNNALEIQTENIIYELSLSLIYKKIKPTVFGALTLVDGDLFSIFPYKDDLYTVTDVEFTPLFQSFTFINKTINDNFIGDIKEKIENKIKLYYPDFLNSFKYDHYFTSTKTKQINQSANRYPSIYKKDNIISCFTGKIQGIYPIQNYITNEINNW